MQNKLNRAKGVAICMPVDQNQIQARETLVAKILETHSPKLITPAFWRDIQNYVKATAPKPEKELEAIGVRSETSSIWKFEENDVHKQTPNSSFIRRIINILSLYHKS